jgi:hypothetical protein
MARRTSKKTNEIHAQKDNFNLIRLVALVLSGIGKPVYFLLSHLILGIIFIFGITGHFLESVPAKLSKLSKPKKRAKKKVKAKKK